MINPQLGIILEIVVFLVIQRVESQVYILGHGSIMWYLMWNMTDFWGKFSTCPMWTKTPFLNSAASSEFDSAKSGHKFDDLS